MKTVFTICLIILSFSVFAQLTIDRQVIAPFGSSGEQFSSTLGELVIGDIPGNEIILTQGFNQQDGNGSVAVIETTEGALEIHAYPNPFVDHFTIDLEETAHLQSIMLIDAQGKLLHQMKINPQQQQYRIEANGWLTGLYGVIVTTDRQKSYMVGWVHRVY